MYRGRVLIQAYRRHGEQLIRFRRSFAAAVEILVKTSKFAKRIQEVPIDLDYSKREGQSKLHFWRTIKDLMKLFFS